MKIRFTLFILFGFILSLPINNTQAESATQYGGMSKENDPEGAELSRAREALSESGKNSNMDFRVHKAASKKRKRRKFTRAEAFVAGPDWEFDGFVAGGQDAGIKSMFVLNDLIYINIGLAQGVEPGDQINVYRRGDRVRDPQSGRFLGYEVRRAAISQITDRVDEETAVARILQTYEGVEVGDLVRKE